MPRAAGWEFAHVAIDHSQAGFVQMHDDERKGSAVAFLQAAVAHYAALGTSRQLLDWAGITYCNSTPSAAWRLLRPVV